MLVLGLGGLIFSAVSRMAVAGPTQLEAEGYAGSSVGQWTCGPTARANYGGVGGHVRVYTDDQPSRTPQRSPPAPSSEEQPLEPPPPVDPPVREAELDLEPMGFSLGAGGAGEHRSFTRVACNETPCSPKNDAIPPGQLLGAGRANVGYDLKYFGVRVGALGYQRWANSNDRSPTAGVLPDVEFRFARRKGFHAGVGFGAYDASTNFRPGGYHTLGYATGPFAVDLRIGGHLVFDDQAGIRADLSMRYAIAGVVAPGLGLAVSSAEQTSPEGRFFIVFTP